ncbi:hypothetical protein ACY1J9_001473 [Clostridium botulinum]
MDINKNLLNKFLDGNLIINCQTKIESDLLIDSIKTKRIKNLIKNDWYVYKNNTCYRISNKELLKAEIKEVVFHRLDFIKFQDCIPQYKTWEIIKIYQEGELYKNDIIIGKNLKERVCDLREENLGIDDLLINEPFTIQGIKFNKDIEDEKNIKALLKDLTEAINKII